MSTQLIASPEIWTLNEMLTALVRERDSAETPEQKSAADEALQLYVSAEVLAKPDIFIAYLRHCQAHAEAADKEANRLAGIGRRWARRAEGLQGFVLAAMREADVKEIEGNLGTFSEQKNPPSVEIQNIWLIPENLCEYNITISGNAWGWLRSWMGSRSKEELAAWEYWSGREDVQIESIPMKAKIAAELKKGPVAGASLISDKTRLTLR